MLENKELGLKVTSSPRETLIYETIENTKKRILQMEVGLELEKNALNFLENLK
jgi:hypothetical protein